MIISDGRDGDQYSEALHLESAERVASLLFELHRRQETILVVVTHNAELAARFPQRFELRDRQLSEV